MTHIDYLAIGHIARDVTPAGHTAGGTAAYAGATARVLGCRTALLTSTGPELDVRAMLPELIVECLPAQRSTTFDNVYDESGRREQYIYGRARPLTAEELPHGWQTASVVHLGPIAGEVDAGLVHCFSNSLIGLTPQGWLRTWDDSGRVRRRRWEQAGEVFPLAAAVVLSAEDVPDAAFLEQCKAWAPLLVLTQGTDGCTVFMGGEERHFPAPDVTEADPTGAGDVFAAAYFIRLYQTKGNPWEAARFANQLAAQSVTRSGFAAKIEHLQAIRG